MKTLLPMRISCFLIAFLFLFTIPVQAATFYVTSSSDSGTGSLRAILLQANNTPELDYIYFNIPGATTSTPAVITLNTELPVIIRPAILVGDRKVIITSNGAAKNGVSVYGNTASGTEIRDLIFNNISGKGGEPSYDNYKGVINVVSSSCLISGNEIASDQQGEDAVLLFNAKNTTVENNTIISYNRGIEIFSVIEKINIKGNKISQVLMGIELRCTGQSCTNTAVLNIGGSQVNEGNTIINYTVHAISLDRGNNTTTIKGNYFGVDREGNEYNQSASSVIQITPEVYNVNGSTGRTYIGGVKPGEGNKINLGKGLLGLVVPKYTYVSGNSIYSDQPFEERMAIQARNSNGQVIKAAPKVLLYTTNQITFRAEITSHPGDTVELFGGNQSPPTTGSSCFNRLAAVPQNARRFLGYAVTGANGKAESTISLDQAETVVLTTARDANGTSEVGLAEETFSCTGRNFAWAKVFPVGRDGWSRIVDSEKVVVDTQGNSFIIGSYWGGVDFGECSLAGGFDTRYSDEKSAKNGYLAKYTADGRLVRLQRIAGQESHVDVKSLAIDEAGNAYVTGRFMGTVSFYGKEGLITHSLTGERDTSPWGYPVFYYDMFIVKYDPEGNIAWAKRAGTRAAQGTNVIAADDGGIYVGGDFKGTAHFGQPSATYTNTGTYGDNFVAKYRADGTLAWIRQHQKPTTQTGFNFYLDKAGNYYFLYHFNGTIDLGDNRIFTSTTTGYNDLLIVKYTNSGSFLWSRQLYKTSNTSSFYGSFHVSADLAINNQGEIYVAGYFKVNLNDADVATFLKLSEEGSVLWKKKLYNYVYQSDQNISSSLALDGAGNVYVTGSNGGESSNSEDVVKLYKYSPNGDFIWKKAAISQAVGNLTPQVRNTGIAVDSTGNHIRIIGFFINSNVEDIDFSYGISFDSFFFDGGGKWSYSKNIYLASVCPQLTPSIEINKLTRKAVCGGRSFDLEFSTNPGFDPDVTFIAQAADIYGSYENAVEIGRASGQSRSMSIVFPWQATDDRIRIIASNGVTSPNHVQPYIYENHVYPPSFSISTDAAIIAGTSYTFTADANRGYTYQWKVDGQPVASEANNDWVLNHVFTTIGEHTVTLTAYYDGCLASSTKRFTIFPAPCAQLSLVTLNHTSCDNQANGALKISSTINNISYRLLRNGLEYRSGSLIGKELTISDLPSGQYTIQQPYTVNCTSAAGTIINDGSPQITACTGYLSCTGSMPTGTLRVELNYSYPPDKFSGQYRYQVRRGNEVVIPETMTPQQATTFSLTIPNAQTTGSYTLEVAPLVTCAEPACQTLEPYCPQTKEVTFAFPSIELSVNATEQIGGLPVFYACSPASSTPVGVVFSSALNACSNSYEGYALRLSKDGGAFNTVSSSSEVLNQIQKNQTLQLGVGNYQLEAEAGTGNYRCTKTISFEVKARDLEISLATTPATCSGDATATASVSGAASSITYSWYKTVDGAITQTLPAAGAQVGSLAPGTYRLEVALKAGNTTCREQKDFEIELAPLIDTVLLSQTSCQGVARAKVPEPGTYRVEWLRRDTVGTSVKDSLLASTYLSVQDSLVAFLPEGYLNDTAYFKAIVYNAANCPVASALTQLAPPRVERLYALCLQWETPEPTPAPAIPVVQHGPTIAATNMRQALEEQVEGCVVQQTKIARATFEASCTTDSTMRDELTLTYPQKYHHYTLYYYDRAGSLVRTVPPAGVVPLTGSNISRSQHPAHEYVTKYDYNSLGQLVRQFTPDGDTTYFVYNNLGQLRFSRNARQKAANTFSYTKYDSLGRVVEVGQAHPVSGAAVPAFTLPSVNPVNDGLMVPDKTATTNAKYPTVSVARQAEKTVTIYSEPKTGVSYLGKQTQRHLQNRVSYTYTYNLADSSQGVYTYYSYDPHGNVEWLVQEIPGLGRNYVAYEYDLISGKVLKVKYNEQQADKFFHRYAYDEDNRLTKVETSRDGYIWEADATYDYYAHGPLKRTSLGEDKVQGVDYTYTIHGWLKGINAPAGELARDLGKDGTNAFSADEFGMSLGYYQGDYKHAGSVFDAATGSVNKYNLSPEKDLYNGNIATWVNHMRTGATGSRIEGEQFSYDRLNRLRSSKRNVFAATDSSWQNSSAYRTNYTYDGNGNLLTLNRVDKTGATLDSLLYTYNAVAGTYKNNRLEKVADRAPATAYADDLEGTNAYEYDAIGNLTKDAQEGVGVKWNVYGKVSEVVPITGSNKPSLKYLYDASGNRVVKSASKGGRENITYYVRDASGNIMSVYNKEVSGTATQLQLTEQPIYGSDRIGQRNEVVYINASQPEENQISTYLWTKQSGPGAKLSNENTATLSLSELVAGTYVFRLTTTDNVGRTGYDEVTLTVKNDPLKDGLVGYWPLDEVTNGTTPDATGIGHTGILVNNPTLTSGKVGGALEMQDNQGRYVNIPSFTWKPTRFSVAFWIHPYARVSNNQQISSDAWGKFMFQVTASGEVLVSTDYTNRLLLPAGTAEIGKWQHFVFTYENGTGRFYKNGQLLAAKINMLNSLTWNGFRIGTNTINGNQTSQSINGKIDEVRIYNRALSGADVANLAAWNNGSFTAPAVNTRSLTWEYWANHTGDITTIPVNTPTPSVRQLTTFEAPSNVGENFGSRIRGYVHPPTTGNYTFWIAGDEVCELYLSTDEDPANKVKIAFATAPTGQRVWTTEASQKSIAINLVAGKKYYVETLQKENTSTDYLSVGWQLPNGTLERPIGSARLSPFYTPMQYPNLFPVVSITSPAKHAAFAPGNDITIQANASDADGTISKVAFFRDTVLLGEATMAPYHYTWNAPASGTYRVTARATDNSGAVATSDDIIVYVGQAPGSMVSVNAGSDLVLNLPGSRAVLTGTARGSSEAGNYYTRRVGEKIYELKDHLGNVRVVVADQKKAEATLATTNGVTQLSIIEKALVQGYYNYYPFGMLQPESFEDKTAAAAGVNNGIQLNGVKASSTLEIAEVSNTFTVELWVNPTATHQIDGEGTSGTAGMYDQKYAIDPANASKLGADHAGMGISVGTNGISVYEHGGSYMPALLVWPGTVSGWTHVAVVYENKQPRLYVNGKLVKIGKTSVKNFVHPSIGFTGGYYGTMNGAIDEVRIWNIARSASDIQDFKDRQIEATATGLVGYWPLDEGTGTVAQDKTSYARHKNLTAVSTWQTPSTSPVVVSFAVAGYRYGYNGKERDSEGMGGGGSTYDYGFRIYNPQIAKFLSVDPLTDSYPELTPYQFASNRPIDGIDLDGLEYYSVHIKIYVDQKGKSHRSLQNIISHRDSEKGYGLKGPGIEYVFTYVKHYANSKSTFSFKASKLLVNRYGIYQGEDNPREYWKEPNAKGEYSYDYQFGPIDEADANGKQHDMDYDAVNAAGPTDAVSNPKTLKADLDYITRANKIIEKYANKENDSVTGKPVTEEAKSAAQMGKTFFEGVMPIKLKMLPYESNKEENQNKYDF